MKEEHSAQLHLMEELEEMRPKISALESCKKHHKTIEPDKEVLRRIIPLPEDDTGDLEFTDFIDVPAIQSLMDSFHEFAHIPMAIVDLKGKVLAGPGWGDICKKFHRVHPVTCRHCIESDTQLSAGVPAGEYKLYKCKNNMWDVATPIVVVGRHVGNVISGQFFFDDEPVDYELFRSQARKYGFPEEGYIAALEAVPRFTRKSLDAGMSFLMKLAQMISLLSYSNIKLARSLSEQDTLVNSLRAAEEKYRGIFENSIEGIYRSTPDGRFVEINPAFARILGYDSPEEVKNRAADIGQQFYVESESRREWMREVIKRDFGSFEVQIRRRDGSSGWVSNKARIVRNEKGETLYFDGYVEDISERKQAEEELSQYRDHLEALVKVRTFQLEERNRQLNSEIAERKRIEDALRKSENEYRTIFENSGTAMVIDEEDTTISMVNTEFERLFHYTRDEVEGKKSWMDLVMKKDLDRLMNYRHLRSAEPKEAPKSYELKMVDRSGHMLDFYATVALIPGTKKRVASLLDITPLKEMEKALAESETLYRNLFENASSGMFQSSFDPGRFLHVNVAYAKMLGYESPEDLMSTVTDISTLHVDPKDRTALLAALKQQDWYYAEYPRFRKDGSIMIGKVSIRRVLNPDGVIDYIEGIVEDVTELRRAEEERKRYLEEITDLYENAPCGYHSLGEDGTILRMNNTELAWLGYSREEVIGKMKITDFITSDRIEWFQRNWPIFMKQGRMLDIEDKWIRKDGSVFDVLVNAVAIYDENGTYLMNRCSVFDNSERKRMEEVLINRERELRVQAQNLLEVNTTMKVLLDTMERDQEELKERFLDNIKAQVMPYVEKLKKTPLNEVQNELIKTAEAHLDDIASPFVQKLTSNYLNLTKKEIQIASLVREGKTSKEIAELLNAKKRVVEFHRENIRKKLGLTNKKESLAILLRSFS